MVEAVGVVTRTPGEDRHEPEAVLITRHLDFSLPYRLLFSGPGVADLRNSLLDALAELLVRIHLAGFFWGDCSLSNTLFRRDAGTLSAYLVDAETGDLHPQLSTGQRAHDLQIAEENVAGELLDLEAADVGLPSGLDPLETAAEVPRRYEALWSELTREDVFGPDETYRIDERLRRLNELGFDVEEVQLVGDAGGQTLRLNPQVVEPGHHRRRLHTLTGLDVQENQARRLLNDLATFRATGGRSARARVGRRLPLADRVLRALDRDRARPTCAASASPPSCSTRSSSTAGSSRRRRSATSACPRRSTRTSTRSCATGPTRRRCSRPRRTT